MPSSFKVTTENYSHTLRIGGLEVVATRLTIADDLKPLSGISKSQKWEFVFKKFKIEEFVELELHVVVIVNSMRGSFRFKV